MSSMSSAVVRLLVMVVMLCGSGVAVAVFAPATLTAPWFNRAAVTWTDGETLFLAGGAIFVYDPARDYAFTPNGYDDVWASYDAGNNWTPLPSLTTATLNTGTYANNAVFYQGQHKVIGGRNQANCGDLSYVWSLPQLANSSSSWSASRTPWGARSFAMATVWTPPIASRQPQQIIFTGGTLCDVANFNDVWSYSSNNNGSSSWSYLGKAPYDKVVGAGIATIKSGASIILAGGFMEGATRASLTNEVWRGSYIGALNGTVGRLGWTRLTANAAFSPRYASLVSTTNDDLYLITGFGGNTQNTNTNDVWTSRDGGRSWLLVSAVDSFSSRIGAGFTSIGRQLILSGGYSTKKDTLYNDVWQAWVDQPVASWANKGTHTGTEQE